MAAANLKLVEGKDVLDVASGEGYGSAMLAGRARSVRGVDISQDAVGHARERYAGVANLQYLQGSAAAIPLPDDSVDVVVSFETIEHLYEQVPARVETARGAPCDDTLALVTMTLAIDCGGTGLKASVLDELGTLHAKPVRVPTPYPLPTARFVDTLVALAADLPRADRATVGIPGMVRHGTL